MIIITSGTYDTDKKSTQNVNSHIIGNYSRRYYATQRIFHYLFTQSKQSFKEEYCPK